jgi:hypothetical protein
VIRWCHEQAHKAIAKEDKAKLRWLDAHLAGKELEPINRDMIDRDQVGRGLRHAPRTARRAKPAALAAEGQQLVVPALAAAKPQETVRQDAALEKGVELVLDEPRQLAAGAGFGVGDEAGRVLLHRSVQRGLLRSMPLVVNRAPSGARWG